MTAALLLTLALTVSVGSDDTPHNKSAAKIAQSKKSAKKKAKPKTLSPDEIVAAMNKSFSCTRDETGVELCRITYQGSTFELRKVKPPAVSQVRLTALGPKHSVRITRDCFEFNVVDRVGAVPVFITPNLEVAKFGAESNKKCGR